MLPLSVDFSFFVGINNADDLKFSYSQYIFLHACYVLAAVPGAKDTDKGTVSTMFTSLAREIHITYHQIHFTGQVILQRKKHVLPNQ